jgi:hypothetical protein
MKNQKRKIVLHLPDEDEPEKITPEKLQEEEVDELGKAIEKLFSPIGETHDMEFYSSMMLQSCLEEWIDVSLRSINQKMEQLGFKSTVIEGSHAWIVYERNHLEF